MQPTPDEVRAELERILTSETFATAGRVSRLLRYVVERTLAGEGDQLKEYVLGVEVFDRGDAYDPRIDSIVRVEVRRLRAKLGHYYHGPGLADPVVITLMPGNYAPVFSPRAAPVPSSHAPATQAAGSRRPIALAAVAVLIVIGLAAWLIFGGRRPEAASGTRIAVLPFAHFSTEADVAMIAARITDGVTADLARNPGLSVVSRTSAAQFTSDQRPVGEVSAALDAALVMEGSVVVEAGGVHVVARLVNAATDRKVWVGEYDSPPDRIADLHRRIADEAAAAALKIPVQQ